MKIQKYLNYILGFFAGVALTFTGVQWYNPSESGDYIGTFNKEGEVIEVVLLAYEDTGELQKNYEVITGKSQRVGAFASFSEKHPRCYIHVPKGKESMTLWGHELAHCVYGHWHD